MSSQCWLHIGIEKTGTTTIQRYLDKNRDMLREQGFLYPCSPGKTSHVGLTACCLPDSILDPIHVQRGIHRREDIPSHRRKMMDGLIREVSESAPAAIILSNEHLSTKIRRLDEIERVKRICDEVAASTKIIVYVRNQVDFLVSRYGTAVKTGSAEQFSLSMSPNIASLLDYPNMLAPWSEVFGRKNMIVRRFEPEDFPDGDLLLDFGAQVGFDSSRLTKTKAANPSLTASALAFLREFNKLVPPKSDGRRNPLRGKIAVLLEGCCEGENFSVPKQFADTIESRYRDSNERTSVEYFDSRFAPLFAPPRHTNGTNSTNDVLDVEHAVAIAAHLWSEQQRIVNKLGRAERRRKQALGQNESSSRSRRQFDPDG